MKADWLPFQDAVDRVLGRATQLGQIDLPLSDALGFVLARNINSPVAIPGFDNSAMDGYAVLGSDLTEVTSNSPACLRVVGRVPAGNRWQGSPLVSGQAIRLMTGGVVPEGADTVVRVEDTRPDNGNVGGWVEVGGVVQVTSARDIGRHIRPRGEDLRVGDRALVRGARVTPGVIALAAAIGRKSLPVVRAPRATIIVTGDELMAPEKLQEVADGAGVPDSNGPMLVAQARACGVAAATHIRVMDDAGALAAAVEEAREGDVLVISGGASMGDADLVKKVLDQMGFALDFWRVRMRPGSPFGFGFVGDLPVFSLPGNPASAFVTFELFCKPFILLLRGHTGPVEKRIRAVAEDSIAGPSHVTSFYRVKLSGYPPASASFAGPQGSGLVSSLANADGLAVLPEGVSLVEPGKEVEVVLLG